MLEGIGIIVVGFVVVSGLVAIFGNVMSEVAKHI